MRREETVNVVQRVDQFLRIRHDWFGEGGVPVPTPLAQARADVCLNGDPEIQKDGTHRCRRHYKGPWIWNMATAMAIAAQTRLKAILNIRLEGEKNLKVCEVCGCKLQLKVFTPIRHLYRHTTPQQVQAFPDHCWIKKEINQLTKP